MLPNVAVIIQSSTRAATAVQNQSHTIRNVLQLQSNSSPSGPSKNGSGSGSSWDNNFFSSGASSWDNNFFGAHKHGTGSRFQSGYHGAARAVTQANLHLTQDSATVHAEEVEDVPPVRVTKAAYPVRRARIRSSSVSLPSVRVEKTGKPGVLKTVQLHARSHHAFALDAPTMEPMGPLLAAKSPSNNTVGRTSAPLMGVRARPPSPSPSRSHSTSVDPVQSAPSGVPPSLEALVNDAPSVEPLNPILEESQSAAFKDLVNARNSGNPEHAAEVVAQFRANCTSPSLDEFNMALEAIYVTRRDGEPLNVLLDVYTDLLSRALQPDLKTYTILLRALLDRDHDINRMVTELERESRLRSIQANLSRMTDKMEEAEAESKKRIEAVRGENNFESAIKIYRSLVQTGYSDEIPQLILQNLLRSCTFHPGSTSCDHALFIWNEVGSRTDEGLGAPTAIMFKYMMQVLGDAGDIIGASEVFDNFNKRNSVNPFGWRISQGRTTKRASHYAPLQIWNTMIDLYFRSNDSAKAIGLVERMIKAAESCQRVSNSEILVQYNPQLPSAPSMSTFTTVLEGFMKIGDFDSAYDWFLRLTKQANAPVAELLQPLATATRPSRDSWKAMLNGFVANDRIDQANALIELWAAENFLERDGIHFSPEEIRSLYLLNVKQVRLMRDELRENLSGPRADSLRASIKSRLQFVMNYIFDSNGKPHRTSCRTIWDEYLYAGMFDEALELLKVATLPYTPGEGPKPELNCPKMIKLFIESAINIVPERLAFKDLMALTTFVELKKVKPTKLLMYELLHSYALATAQDPVSLEVAEWDLLVRIAIRVELQPLASVVAVIPDFASGGLLSVLKDALEAVPDLHSAHCMSYAVECLLSTGGAEVVHALSSHERLRALLKYVPSRTTSPSAESATRSISDESAAPSFVSTAPTSPMIQSVGSQSLIFAPDLTSEIDDLLVRSFRPSDLAEGHIRRAQQIFLSSFSKFVVPDIPVIGRLIEALGRIRDTEAAKAVYNVAQDIMAAMADQPQRQSQSWNVIENSMLIALCQGGDIDGAHFHRTRILENGGALSADAYGGLILHVKDTTDDTANAYALWQESQACGVVPNQYLYNNIISKLAKARKADHALELFHQMRASGVEPSSITYGALIGACTRVGDALSAEALFDEMVNQRNFKPRVPPYNTMMQLYTTSKPNKERALYFYEQMVNAGVRPTAHTYKLLMDVFTLEPIDIRKVEELFHQARQHKDIRLHPFHFSALINAHGCVLKDLDKAIGWFKSIPKYQASSRVKLLDATVVESMINVAVAHRRMDLVPSFVETMNENGVHMTAYIVNSMIKGYAVIGDLERAREVFESLSDPVQGMAALHNHAPHNPEQAPEVGVMEPVYREPSTWEAMIRAELGAGHRDQATALLDRLQARHYPEAVFNRISGILVDHSQIPPPES